MTQLEDIRDSLEGMIPGVISTCAPDGTPNVCYISQVEYVDHEHVALSFQFFNKTRQNVLANPLATVAVVDATRSRAPKTWERWSTRCWRAWPRISESSTRWCSRPRWRSILRAR